MKFENTNWVPPEEYSNKENCLGGFLYIDEKELVVVSFGCYKEEKKQAVVSIEIKIAYDTKKQLQLIDDLKDEANKVNLLCIPSSVEKSVQFNIKNIEMLSSAIDVINSVGSKYEGLFSKKTIEKIQNTLKAEIVSYYKSETQSPNLFNPPPRTNSSVSSAASASAAQTS